MTHVADEMKVAWVPVGRFKARSAFAEIHLAGDSGVDHPLERAIHRGAPDPGVLAAYEVAEIVGAQVALLARENIEDAVAFRRTLAAGRAQAGEVQGRLVDAEG